MTRQAVADLGAALKRRQDRREAKRGKGRYRGVVKGVDPLKVDVAGIDLDLDDEDVTIGDALAARLDDAPLEEGDTLALLEMDDDDWVAVDVLREHAPPEGP